METFETIVKFIFKIIVDFLNLPFYFGDLTFGQFFGTLILFGLGLKLLYNFLDITPGTGLISSDIGSILRSESMADQKKYNESYEKYQIDRLRNEQYKSRFLKEFPEYDYSKHKNKN